MTLHIKNYQGSEGDYIFEMKKYSSNEIGIYINNLPVGYFFESKDKIYLARYKIHLTNDEKLCINKSEL